MVANENPMQLILKVLPVQSWAFGYALVVGPHLYGLVPESTRQELYVGKLNQMLKLKGITTSLQHKGMGKEREILDVDICLTILNICTYFNDHLLLPLSTPIQHQTIILKQGMQTY